MEFTTVMKIALRTVCLIMVLNLYETESATGAYNQLISSLYKKAVNENRPLILVLDNSGASRGPHPDSHEHGESLKDRLKKHSVLDLFKGKYKQKSLGHPKLRSQDLKTPLVKGLLALRNSLSCAAQDECADDCAPNKKQNDCIQQCEVQYECKPKNQYNCEDTGDCGSVDACENSNDCDDKEISTKGELWSQETVKCKRC